MVCGECALQVQTHDTAGDCHVMSCDLPTSLYRIAMLLVILLNCVVIGVQTDRYLVSGDVIPIVLQLIMIHCSSGGELWCRVSSIRQVVPDNICDGDTCEVV